MICESTNHEYGLRFSSVTRGVDYIFALSEFDSEVGHRHIIIANFATILIEIRLQSKSLRGQRVQIFALVKTDIFDKLILDLSRAQGNIAMKAKICLRSDAHTDYLALELIPETIAERQAIDELFTNSIELSRIPYIVKLSVTKREELGEEKYIIS